MAARCAQVRMRLFSMLHMYRAPSPKVLPGSELTSAGCSWGGGGDWSAPWIQGTLSRSTVLAGEHDISMHSAFELDSKQRTPAVAWQFVDGKFPTYTCGNHMHDLMGLPGRFCGV